MRKSLARLLDSAGFAPHAFADSKAFLDHLATHDVPVAVLDIWRGHLAGMELLAHLCARSPDTRVIFITAHEGRAAQSTIMRAGAFDLFIKPFDPNCFLDAIGRAFASTSTPTGCGGLAGGARQPTGAA